MTKQIILEKIINNESIDLPIDLKEFNLNKFGLDYKLFDYQQEAIKKVIKLLFEFYNGSKNGNSEKFLSLYKKYGMNEDMESHFNIARNNDNFDFMSNFYNIFENRYIEFKNIINRAGFWMATGSGKTIIMIKLIEVLFNMVKKGYIPQKDILILAPKDTILEQIKKHVDIFNMGNPIKIELKDLRDWEKVKQQQLNLFSGNNKITVFYFRADNIREENKEALIDYKTYLNGGNWYLILDEAHKGDNEFSKSQQYFNVLSQNGFLFNFSATFVDELDIATTLYNFNLERFISSGYGKHIKLTNQEFKSFRKKKDVEFSDEERQKIVLKSLLTYTAIKKIKEKINIIDNTLFHNPLMLTVANSVNTMDSDLKIFFQELAKIAKGEGDIESIKTDLIINFKNDPKYYFNYGEEITSTLINEINSITKKDIAKYVFNSDNFGSIEVVTIVNNSKEIAFKLTTANKPFALLVASEATKWTTNILSGYSLSKNIITESFFDKINEKSNNINILMGSRIFIEGWDSNRPNVINFINLGVGDAQKLVLQTIGRGVRINPLNNERIRIEKINYNNERASEILSLSQAIQSLFLFTTNKNIIKDIISNLDKNTTDDYWTIIKGFRKNPKINNKLIKPVIDDINDNKIIRKFKISKKEFRELNEYLTPINTKIAIVDNDIDVETLNKLSNDNNFTFTNSISKETKTNILLKLNRFFKMKNYKLKEYKPLENSDIQSYKKIKIKNIKENELKKLEFQIKNSIENKNYSVEDLVKQLQKNEITTEDFLKKQKIAENCNIEFNKLNNNLSRVVNEHYYNPVFVSKKEYNDYFTNIIKEDSEIDFIQDLFNYITHSNNLLKKYDWWYFSKLVENIDNIKIPYYNSIEESISQFYPDFIFWLKKDNKYFIKFIDPKGIEHPRNAVDKIAGFKNIFNTNKKFENNEVQTDLYFYNKNQPAELAEHLEEYWTNDFDYIFNN